MVCQSKHHIARSLIRTQTIEITYNEHCNDLRLIDISGNRWPPYIWIWRCLRISSTAGNSFSPSSSIFFPTNALLHVHSFRSRNVQQTPWAHNGVWGVSFDQQLYIGQLMVDSARTRSAYRRSFVCKSDAFWVVWMCRTLKKTDARESKTTEMTR